MTREGFDVRIHAVSLLSNGSLGWIQITNFLVSGVLVVAGAIGARRVLREGRGATWGPILLACYGVGLIGAGIFVADPGRGFPPGSPEFQGMSSHGLGHFIAGGFGFYALIAACFVFARRFAGLGRTGFAAYSVFTGVAFFAAFAGVASGSTSVMVMLSFYAAVAWIWGGHLALSITLLRGGLSATPVRGAAS